ncbi:MAG: phosphopantothenoylcysteine decarboxylase [Elusimicrobiota bacterium]|nr:phosphopantothenoylcysteine decarboxylase [Elusimicrobiota bacterium]
MKVLLTFGGTREYIDAARFITNMSTGRTGRIIAERFAARGCKTMCLCAQGAERPAGKNISVREFTGFKDLDLELQRLLKTQAFDAVVHLAAVSDYSPALIEAGGKRIKPGRAGKLDSEAPVIKLVLKRNFKIIDRIKKYAAAGKKAPPLLIGFKLTSGAAAERVLEKVRALSSADLVVHNDLAEMKKKHFFHIYRNGCKLADCGGPEELADRLYPAIWPASGKSAGCIQQ